MNPLLIHFVKLRGTLRLNGIHFQRPDGQIQAEFVGKLCHYEDGGKYLENI